VAEVDTLTPNQKVWLAFNQQILVITS
jgi:hypothetical protein